MNAKVCSNYFCFNYEKGTEISVPFHFKYFIFVISSNFIMKLSELSQLKSSLESSFFNLGNGINHLDYKLIENKIISKLNFQSFHSIPYGKSNTGSYIQFLKPKSALLRINENENVIMLAIRSEETVWIVNLENSTLRKTELKEIRNHVKSMSQDQSLEIFELF